MDTEGQGNVPWPFCFVPFPVRVAAERTEHLLFVIGRKIRRKSVTRSGAAMRIRCS